MKHRVAYYAIFVLDLAVFVVFVPAFQAEFQSGCLFPGTNCGGPVTFYESLSVALFNTGAVWCGHTYQLVDWRNGFSINCG